MTDPARTDPARTDPDRTDRDAGTAEFLLSVGWAGAQIHPLAGDASDRSYARLTRGGQTAILMNAPPGTGDDPADFVRIAGYLAEMQLSVPAILGQDLTQGFLLLEDFGDALFARLLADDPAQEAALYRAATDVLIHLSKAPLPKGLPDLTARDWAQAAGLAVTDYAAPLTPQTDLAEFVARLTQTLHDRSDGPRIFIHRDFHAENLILLPDRQGLRRVGLLDFQLGQAGQPGYDLVSLLQDARRDVSTAVETAMIDRYAMGLGLDLAGFAVSYAALGAQRALRIIGIFARLATNGKPRYLALIPRVWAQLQRNLAHPALSDLRSACAILPPPTPETLQRLTPP